MDGKYCFIFVFKFTSKSPFNSSINNNEVSPLTFGKSKSNSMTTVTLTTDFGNKDYYAAVLKGALVKEAGAEKIQIIDITHEVKSFDIVQGAYILKNAFPHFPEGSIHIITVNNAHGNRPSYIAFKKDKHFFIGPDNGLFSLMFDSLPANFYELELLDGMGNLESKTIAKAVKDLTSGKPISEVGSFIEDIIQRLSLQPVISNQQIRGAIVYIDHYGNAVLNISTELFKRVRHGRDFKMYFKRHDPITKVVRHYQEVEVGETVCIFNSAGLLEIAINMGRASELLDLAVGETVEVNFD